MQGILVTIIFVAALAYLGFILYKNFKGEAGCSTNCGCDSPVHQFKKKAEAKS
ncbi:MAG: FeoB-associated Cys-rich membrane protein [Fulvivirga sp.]